MNLNSKKRQIFLCLFILAELTISAKKPVGEFKVENVVPEYTTEEKIEHTLDDHQKLILKQKDPICHIGLVKAYGMKGRSAPSTEKMQVCPGVESSCCMPEDQLVIIENVEKDRKNLQRRLDKQLQVITDMLAQMKTLSQIGSRMKSRLAKKRLTNCKVLLARFSAFNIDEIAEEVNRTLKELHEFLKTSYKGFFCTICDGTKHIYFHSKYKTEVMSHEFCRQFMANGIKVLRYLHGHLTKYANFAAHFAGFCDITGKFLDEPIDGEFRFEHSKAQTDIAKCWNGRNQPFWVFDCQDFCQNFSPIKFEEFFEPHIKKYMRITRFLEKRNKELLFQESREPLLNLPDNFTPESTKSVGAINPERKLAETGTTDSTTKSPATKTTPKGVKKTTGDEKKTESDSEGRTIDYSEAGIAIFMRGLQIREVISASLSVGMSGKEGAPYDLIEYAPVFHEEGLNFYESGKATLSNMDLYMQIRDQIKAKEQSANSDAPQATDDQVQEKVARDRRRLKKASLLSAMAMVVLGVFLL
jgi:hypothetical protein